MPVCRLQLIIILINVTHSVCVSTINRYNVDVRYRQNVYPIVQMSCNLMIVRLKLTLDLHGDHDDRLTQPHAV